METTIIDSTASNHEIHKAQNKKLLNTNQKFATELANQTQKINKVQNNNMTNPTLKKAAKGLEQALYFEMFKQLSMGSHEDKEYEGGIMEEVFSQELMQQYTKKIVSGKNSRLAQIIYKDLEKMSRI